MITMMALLQVSEVSVSFTMQFRKLKQFKNYIFLKFQTNLSDETFEFSYLMKI